MNNSALISPLTAVNVLPVPGSAKQNNNVRSKAAFKSCGVEYDIFNKARGALFGYSLLSENIAVSDILLYTLMLMQKHPEVSEKFKSQCKLMLVDEAQDLSLLHLRVISYLTDCPTPQLLKAALLRTLSSSNINAAFRDSHALIEEAVRKLAAVPNVHFSTLHKLCLGILSENYTPRALLKMSYSTPQLLKAALLRTLSSSNINAAFSASSLNHSVA